MIHAYILDLANGNTGTDWTARLSLLFIGANYDAIDKVTLATKYNKFNEAEASLNQRILSSTEMSEAGIQIEKNVDGTFNHIIPSNIKFAYDAVGLSGSLPLNIDPSKMDGVYDMNFSDKSGTYVITFKKRDPQPTVSAGANVLPAGIVTGKQEVAKVTVAREKRLTLRKQAKQNEIKEFQAKQEFANELYNEVGHQKRPEFKELLDAINTRDPDARDTAISKIAKIDKPLFQKLLADKDNYLTWTTYMYGSKESRMKDNPSQSGADAMRTPDVLRAEA